MNPRNILVAVDGSEQSFEAVRYTGRLFPNAQARITLLHILDVVPEYIWDFESGLDLRCQLGGIRGWELHQRDSIETFMGQARRLLVSMGYFDEAVQYLVKDRKEDIARDIAAEARQGYDALVVGRHGLSRMKDLLFGSISFKLLSSTGTAPIWVVGGKPDTNRVLIALDNSEGAKKALDHVIDMFGEKHPEILLVHVSRRLSLLEPDIRCLLLIQEGKDWMERADRELRITEDRMESYLEECVARLEKRGADRKRIRTRMIHEAISRSAAIVKEAEEGGYGTIVLGKRGLSKLDEFIMGRVSSKVLQLAREKAVWIVH